MSAPTMPYIVAKVCLPDWHSMEACAARLAAEASANGVLIANLEWFTADAMKWTQLRANDGMIVITCVRRVPRFPSSRSNLRS